MLSILIPEHDCNCTELVGRLSEQCQQETIVFEIIVMDDASSLHLKENRRIADIPGCRFVENTQNLQSGRVRNRLGGMAVYPWLLMLDSDLEIRDDQFIHRYLEVLGKAPVVVGSIVYPTEKPPVEKRLRWVYGRHRESLSVEIRNQNPWKSFPSQNFLIDKKVFEKVPFNEDFHRYGHEDTLFGIALKKQGIPVSFIDNPLIHKGLESSEIFLAKSLIATEKYLTEPSMQEDEVVEQIRIFRVYRQIRQLKLDGLLAWKFSLLEKCLKRNLCGPSPKLIFFDFYRLGHLCRFVRKTDAPSDRI
jgi:glycosyltransferase involved in cell wall biosynthesis